MKITSLFFICFLSVIYSEVYSQTQRRKLNLDVGMKYNISNLDWSIAGNLEGNSPNILSELKFKNVISFGTYIKGEYNSTSYLVLHAYFNKNKVLDGHGTDTDFKDNNRINPTFEKEFVSNKGDFTTIKAGIGSPIQISSTIEITPLVLYYFTSQKYYILNPEMDNLNSTYQADMEGAEISIKTNISLNKSLYMSFDLSCHLVEYDSQADWNLIDILKHPVSFTQTSKGYGCDIGLKFRYEINKIFSINVGGDLNITTIKKGIDTSYLVNDKEISTQFNGANNNVYGLKLGVSASL